MAAFFKSRLRQLHRDSADSSMDGSVFLGTGRHSTGCVITTAISNRTSIEQIGEAAEVLLQKGRSLRRQNNVWVVTTGRHHGRDQREAIANF